MKTSFTQQAQCSSHPTEQEKKAVWAAFEAGTPTRVPVQWNVNPRIVIQNPMLNTEGWTFEQCMHDPAACVGVQLRFQEHVIKSLAKTCDMSEALPDAWHVGVMLFNTYEGAFFGAPYGQTTRYREGQCPSTEHFLTEDDADEFLKQDYSRPMENAWIQSMLQFHKELSAYANGMRHCGRPVVIDPFCIGGSDGVVTTCADLFGEDFFYILGDEPEKAVRMMEMILEAQITRTHALGQHAGIQPQAETVWYADDSVQLLSMEMYDSLILPLHRRWYAAFDPTWTKRHGMHLCGDATRHFPSLQREANVIEFDTGFPVNFSWLRNTLGPQTRIRGGVPVATLLNESPQSCYNAAKNILQSGIMNGGQFMLTEANNLPPCVPLENLDAVYAACLEFGQYAE